MNTNKRKAAIFYKKVVDFFVRQPGCGYAHYHPSITDAEVAQLLGEILSSLTPEQEILVLKYREECKAFLREVISWNF
jgi:hypothetical protein